MVYSVIGDAELLPLQFRVTAPFAGVKVPIVRALGTVFGAVAVELVYSEAFTLFFAFTLNILLVESVNAV